MCGGRAGWWKGVCVPNMRDSSLFLFLFSLPLTFSAHTDVSCIAPCALLVLNPRMPSKCSAEEGEIERARVRDREGERRER